ncbi:hypothetical protein [Devosia riboflavina]
MADEKPEDKADNPALKDVEPGSDADETPVADPEKTPTEPKATLTED